MLKQNVRQNASLQYKSCCLCLSTYIARHSSSMAFHYTWHNASYYHGSSMTCAILTSSNLYNITASLLTTFQLHRPSISFLNIRSYFLLWTFKHASRNYSPLLFLLLSPYPLLMSLPSFSLIVPGSFPSQYLPRFLCIYLWVHFVVPLEIRKKHCLLYPVSLTMPDTHYGCQKIYILFNCGKKKTKSPKHQVY